LFLVRVETEKNCVYLGWLLHIFLSSGGIGTSSCYHKIIQLLLMYVVCLFDGV